MTQVGWKLKTGDTVYVTSHWRKQGIIEITVGMVHGNYAKVMGDLMQLGKHFFMTRGEAFQDVCRRADAGKRTAETHYKRTIADIDRILSTEQDRAREAGRAERNARREELAARADEKLGR